MFITTHMHFKIKQIAKTDKKHKYQLKWIFSETILTWSPFTATLDQYLGGSSSIDISGGGS